MLAKHLKVGDIACYSDTSVHWQVISTSETEIKVVVVKSSHSFIGVGTPGALNPDWDVIPIKQTIINRINLLEID